MTCLAQGPESADSDVGLLSAVTERQILVCSSVLHGFNLWAADQIFAIKDFKGFCQSVKQKLWIETQIYELPLPSRFYAVVYSLIFI